MIIFIAIKHNVNDDDDGSSADADDCDGIDIDIVVWWKCLLFPVVRCTTSNVPRPC